MINKYIHLLWLSNPFGDNFKIITVPHAIILPLQQECVKRQGFHLSAATRRKEFFFHNGSSFWHARRRGVDGLLKRGNSSRERG
jgi:hypothetical protein